MPLEPLQNQHATKPQTIGWCEKVVLPDFVGTKIDAKIDTGAKFSSIHALDITEFEKGRSPWVSFFIYPAQNTDEPEIFCRAPVIDKRTIKSSNGKSENRYVVRTTLKIGKKSIPFDLTLADRSSMNFRLLLGRDALQNGFLVDPGTAYILNE